jgi:hypothetical protein
VRRVRSAIFLGAATALVVAAAAFAAMPAGGARYAGRTSEHLRVTLRVSGDGAYVAHMRIRFRVKCDDGARGRPSTDLADLRIDRHGGFEFDGTYTGKVDRSRNHVRLQGTISARRASGTFKLTAKRKKVRCHSARITWHARVAS